MSPQTLPVGHSESAVSDQQLNHGATQNTPYDFPEAPPEVVAEIRRRIAELPKETIERAHHALMHEHIDRGGSILYRAGICLCSAELREYRKTLFPPNSLVDPLTNEAPVLRNPTSARSADSLSASPPTREQPSETSNPQGEIPLPSPTETDSSRRSETKADVTPVTDGPTTDNGPLTTDGFLTTDNGSLTTGSALLSDLRDLLKRYVVLPDMAAEALALWVVHTYAFTLRQVTTYIGVVSPEKRCGKTTLLELLGLLANRSLAAANISPSALFRVIEHTQPTLLIDEADTFLQGRDELAGILNAGYRKGNSYVVRVADARSRRKHENVGGTSYTSPQNGTPPEFGEWTNDPVTSDPTIHSSANPSINGSDAPNPCNNLTNHHVTTLARFSCWCPKVMAAIGRLPDTLADRCIIITMQRKMPGETCERMRQLNAAEYRKRCADFVREHSHHIAQAQPEIPSTLNDRAADIWEPLLAIADLAGGEWPQLAREAAQKLSASDDDLSLIAYFLKDLRNLMVIKNVEKMLSRDIIAILNPLHDRPWEDLRRGREINEWWLGWQLRQLGMRTRTLRVGGAIAKGYTLADIEGAFRRYVPNADLHLNDVRRTSDTSPQSAASLKGEIPNLKSSDNVSLKDEIPNVKSPHDDLSDAELDRLMKQLLGDLPNPGP